MPLNQSPASQDRVVSGYGRLAAVSVSGMVALVVLLVTLHKVGLPVAFGALAAYLLFVGMLAHSAYRTGTGQPNDWLFCANRAAAPIVGMAGAAAVFTGPLLLLAAGLLQSRSEMGPVLLAAPMAGLAIGTILVGGILRASGTATLAEFLNRRFRSTTFRLLVMIAVTAAGFLLLWAQMRVGMLLAGSIYPLGPQVTVLLLGLVIAVCVLPGGLFGVIRTNALLYLVLATSLFLPLVWLSQQTTGFPIPQLAFGYGAAGPVRELEAELTAIGFPLIADRIDTGWPSIPGGYRSWINIAFLTLGFAALTPFLLGFQASRNSESARISGLWALTCAAIVLTAIPAIAAFATQGLYEGLLGIRVGEADTLAAWLFEWSAQSSAIRPGAALIEICGASVVATSELVAACGGNPDYVIGPADIRASGELAIRAFAQIGNLPAIFSAIALIGLLAAVLATANAAVSTLAMTLAEDSGGYRAAPQNAAAARLFRLRACGLLVICAACWLAAHYAVSPIQLTMWAFAIGAGAIAPVMICAIWVTRLNSGAAILGLIAPLFVLAEFPLLVWLQNNSRNGAVEATLHDLPGLAGLPLPVQAGAAAFAVSILAIAIASLFGRRSTSGYPFGPRLAPRPAGERGEDS